MTVTRKQVSRGFARDLARAVRILKDGGCTEVFVFGSTVAGRSGRKSDIDIAVRGCPSGRFFHLFGRLMMELDHPVDLIDLDSQHSFGRYLQTEGELVRVD